MAKISSSMVVAMIAIIVSLSSFTYTYTAIAPIGTEIAGIKSTLNRLTTPSEYEKLVEAAKKEGTVVVWTSWPTEYMTYLTDMFKVEYPWIVAEWYRAGSGELWQKYSAEVAAGKVSADVFSVADVALITKMKQNGWILRYDSSFYDSYKEGFYDRGYWCAWRNMDHPILFNKKFVTSEIKSYQDLLRPEFKGKLVSEDPRQGGAELFVWYSLYKKFGREYIAKLAEQRVVYVEAGADVCEKVASGEAWAAVHSYGYRMVEYRDKTKGIVDGVYLAEIAPLAPVPMAITAQAKHPNAAKLFMEWLFSLKGQATVVQKGTYSVRLGAPAPAGMPAFSSLNAWPTTMKEWEDYIANYDAILKEMQALLGK